MHDDNLLDEGRTQRLAGQGRGAHQQESACEGRQEEKTRARRAGSLRREGGCCGWRVDRDGRGDELLCERRGTARAAADRSRLDSLRGRTAMRAMRLRLQRERVRDRRRRRRCRRGHRGRRRRDGRGRRHVHRRGRRRDVSSRRWRRGLHRSRVGRGSGGRRRLGSNRRRQGGGQSPAGERTGRGEPGECCDHEHACASGTAAVRTLCARPPPRPSSWLFQSPSLRTPNEAHGSTLVPSGHGFTSREPRVRRRARVARPTSLDRRRRTRG